MAVTSLNDQLLAAIGKGIASTKILPVTGGAVTINNLDFSAAGQIFSIEDSFSLDWGEPTLDEVRVDQGLKVIDMKVEQGEVSFSANYPTIAEVALKEFFKHATSQATVKSTADVSYTGTSIFTDPKTTEVSLLIEDQNNEFAVLLARVSITARLAYDNDNKIWYIGLDGRVLSNLAAGQGDVFVGQNS